MIWLTHCIGNGHWSKITQIQISNTFADKINIIFELNTFCDAFQIWLEVEFLHKDLGT